MRHFFSEIFGFAVLAVSLGLAIWQHFAYRKRDANEWLLTRRRYWRRIAVSMILGIIGLMMVAESRGWIQLNAPTALTLYVFALAVLSILLLILAALDAWETANSLTRHSLGELERAIEERRRAETSEEGNRQD